MSSRLMFHRILEKAAIWSPAYELSGEAKRAPDAFERRIREDLAQSSIYVVPAATVDDTLRAVSPPKLIEGSKKGWIRVQVPTKHCFVEVEKPPDHIGTIYHTATLEETYADVSLFPVQVVNDASQKDPDFLDRMIARLDDLGATRVIHTATFLSDDVIISGPISSTTFAVNAEGVIVQQGISMLTGQGVDKLTTQETNSALLVAWKCHAMLGALADGALEARWATKPGDPRPYRMLSRKKEVPWPLPRT